MTPACNATTPPPTVSVPLTLLIKRMHESPLATFAFFKPIYEKYTRHSQYVWFKKVSAIYSICMCVCVSSTATIKHKVEQCNSATARETETKWTGSHMNVIYKCKYLPLWHNRKWATSWQICCVNIYIHIHTYTLPDR